MKSVPKSILNSEILLNADNFTPLSRTPWAGTKITDEFKNSLLPECQGKAIGECWEVSTDPTFPSQVLGNEMGITLQDAINLDADLALADFAQQKTCEILLKTLNAASPLSLQVHPTDQDPGLSPNECGKPESWYVISSDPGCGIYLGFKQKLNTAELRTILTENQNLEPLLNFVPVKPGDFFEIDPGVPHAVGPGVLLLEPQRIRSGKTGKTYRMWDWNRRYNPQGQLDTNGSPRELHIEQALGIVDPTEQVGGVFVDSLRRSPEVQKIGALEVSLFPEGSTFQTIIIASLQSENITIDIANGYGVALVLEGTIQSQTDSWQKGQPVFLPAAALPLPVSILEKSRLALVIPAGSSLKIDRST